MINIPAIPTYDSGAQPANTIPVPTGFDPTTPNWIDDLMPTGETHTYRVSVEPATSVPPYHQIVALTPQLKLGLPVKRLPYSLTPQLHVAPTTPLLLSETCTSFVVMTDNFFASWPQQVYGWNRELQPYVWAT